MRMAFGHAGSAGLLRPEDVEHVITLELTGRGLS